MYNIYNISIYINIHIYIYIYIYIYVYKYKYNGMNTTLLQYSEFILVVTQQS